MKAVAALAVLVAVATSCGDDTTVGSGGGAAVDESCETADDCQEGLECDVHDGEGTCQEPH